MEDELYEIFVGFASFGAGKDAAAELDNAKFAKFARDCGVLDKSVTSTSIDLIFAKVKPKAARKINFEQFTTALHQVASAKYPGKTPEEAYETLVAAILGSHGPKVASKTPVDVSGIYSKLTDTSLYTGAHKERFDDSGHGKGLAGRDSVSTGAGSHAAPHATGAVNDLSQITRDTMRGGTTLSSASRARDGEPKIERSAAVRRPSHGEHTIASAAPAARGAFTDEVAAGSPSDLHSIFGAYCSFGGGSASEMDNAKFAKLCRESGILDKTVVPASVDITFSKVKDKAKRLITFEQFLTALKLLAKEKYRTDEPDAASQKIIDLVIAAGGPGLVGTSAADSSGVYAKLTDHSLYTGAHKERFDEAGVGKGIEGRESVGKGSGHGKYHGGAVADLSQITRSNL